MADTEVDPIERLIKPHLAKRLDPHLGKAARAFAEHVGKAETAAVATSHRFILWWAPAIGALAACIMVGLLLKARYDRPEIAGPNPTSPTPRSDLPGTLEVHRTISWQNFDEGTVMIDEQTPARLVRRQVLETSQWYDAARKSLVEVSLPREEVMLIGLNRQ